MSHYKSNLRDIEFNYFEVFGAGDPARIGAVTRTRHHAFGADADHRPVQRAEATRLAKQVAG